MQRKIGIVDGPRPPRKPPWALTDQEMLALMRNLTTGQTTILDDDALAAALWAQAHKRSAYLLHGVLSGVFRITVEGGVVHVPSPPGWDRRN